MPGRPTPAEGGLDASGLKVAVIASRFHQEVTARLAEGALRFLKDAGATDVDLHWVPGALEIPLAARALARAGADALVAAGCVIRGRTAHFEIVARESAAGIMRVSLDTGVPIGNAILACESLEQALARAGGEEGDKGHDAAASAVEMALFARRLRPGTPRA